eukprot:360667-Chlamydomonas_euryale.AAC.9
MALFYLLLGLDCWKPCQAAFPSKRFGCASFQNKVCTLFLWFLRGRRPESDEVRDRTRFSRCAAALHAVGRGRLMHTFSELVEKVHLAGDHLYACHRRPRVGRGLRKLQAGASLRGHAVADARANMHDYLELLAQGHVRVGATGSGPNLGMLVDKCVLDETLCGALCNSC